MIDIEYFKILLDILRFQEKIQVFLTASDRFIYCNLLKFLTKYEKTLNILSNIWTKWENFHCFY